MIPRARKTWLLLAGAGAAAALAGYLTLWPVELEPAAWIAPAPPPGKT